MRLLQTTRYTLVAASLVAVGSTACAGLGNRVDGTLVEVLDTGDPGTGAVIVELDEGDLAGSTDVQLNFDLDVLRCIDGGDATADDLRPGIDVRAQRFDSEEIDTMDPPGFAAQTLRFSAMDD